MKLILTVLIVCCSIAGAKAQAHHMVADTARTVNPIIAPNPPLFIVNGKEIQQDSAQYILNILPDDIQAIEVLKGEKAQLAYGEKGKNGVVIITLKDLTKFRSFKKSNKNR